MASLSKLSNLNPSYSPTSFNPKSFQPTACLIKAFNGKTAFDQRVFSSRLSLRGDHASWGSLVVRCSSLDGNGSQIKRTVLHDLYEKEGQSPWYDNLCRPVTDLLPLIASGVRGVTSNPAVVDGNSYQFCIQPPDAKLCKRESTKQFHNSKITSCWHPTRSLGGQLGPIKCR